MSPDGVQARGRFVQIAERAVRFYVPAVHAVAAATFLGWWLLAGVGWQAALVPAVATLIVTCPCGFALAVPMVQSVAVGALFRRGILVASGTALERLASADYAVLDKTGTLTLGRPSLLPGVWTAAQLHAAASLARASRHPLAQALIVACPDAPLREEVREVPGQGLSAKDAWLGNASFVGAPELGDGPTLWFREGESAPVAFRFADALRPNAKEALQRLGALGLRVELLSGDVAPAVAAAAREVGIAVWTAQAGPEGKAARVGELRKAGARPLMVGDGINDAAALAVAHVSICVGEGADLAKEAADLVLCRQELGSLTSAIVTARRAQRLMRQNIAF